VLRVLRVAAITLCLVACGSVPAGSPDSSGSPTPTKTSDLAVNVRGTIDRGPIASCPPGEPCDPPIVAAFVVFSQPGKADVRFKVGAGGAFAGHLDPGAYSVSAAPPPNGRLDPHQVRIPSTGTVDLQLVVRPA